jgi:Putative auto-transporter adhesin, head GIN domain
VVQKDVDFFEVKKIEIQGGFEVEMRLSNRNHITLMMDDNLTENTKIDNSGETLQIKEDAKVEEFAEHKIIIELTTPPERIAIKGDIQFTWMQSQTFDYLKLVVEGENTVYFPMEANRLKLTAVGNNKIETQGKIVNAEVELNKNSVWEANGTKIVELKISLDDNAKANVDVSSELEADASRNAVLNYRGEPTIELTANGNAKITKIE